MRSGEGRGSEDRPVVEIDALVSAIAEPSFSIPPEGVAAQVSLKQMLLVVEMPVDSTEPRSVRKFPKN